MVSGQSTSCASIIRTGHVRKLWEGVLPAPGHLPAAHVKLDSTFQLERVYGLQDLHHLRYPLYLGERLLL